MTFEPTACIACRCGETWRDSSARDQGAAGVAFIVAIALAEVSVMSGRVPMCEEHEQDLARLKRELRAAAEGAAGGVPS